MTDPRFAASERKFDMGPCPCDTCPNWSECQTGKACIDFVAYVELDKIFEKYRKPRADVFNSLYRPDLQTKGLRLNIRNMYRRAS